MVQSIARENSILLNARASLCPKGSSFIFSDRIFHSSRGYTKRQVSRPKVIINFSPKDSRYFAGTINLPFSSIVCSYCPKNIKSPLYLSLIQISEPTRLGMISYAVFCLKKKKHKKKKN